MNISAANLTDKAKRAYQSIFQILGTDILAVLGTLLTAFIISLVFWIAKTQNEVAIAQVETAFLQKEKEVLEQDNERIQEQVGHVPVQRLEGDDMTHTTRTSHKPASVAHAQQPE